MEDVSLIDASLFLARQNVRLFPCRFNSKLPAVKNFSDRATDDIDELKKLFSYPGQYNSGIACGKVSTGLYLVGVDIDKKDGRDGFKTIDDLAVLGKELPATWTQETPSGGRHMLYWSPIPIRQGTNVLGTGVDLRGDGGYLCGPWSVLNGRYYRPIHQRPIVMFPDWAIDSYKKTAEVIPIRTKVVPVQDQILALKRAVEYLSMSPPVVAGERNNEGYKVVCKLKDLGVASDQMEDILLQYWKCEPMIESNEINALINSAFKYGANSPGVLAPENVFDKIEPSVKEKTTTPELIFNRDHFYVASEGVSRVCLETSDEKGEFHLERFPVNIFHEKYAARNAIGGSGKPFSLTKAWMTSIDRREYQKIRFYPGKKQDPKVYNLWKGFAVKPATHEQPNEGVDLFLEHCLQNICEGSQELNDWLMGFFAHIFQHPEEKPRVALVFQGLKGTGKSIVSEILNKMIGKYTVTVPDKSHLSNHFNAIMEDKLLITLEEAFWSGDKSVDGVLKSLITSPNRLITYKGAQPYTTEVFDRIIIIGNDDHIVPATGEERRYAVFTVGEGRWQDQDFFGRMLQGLKNGGYQQLMRLFLTYEIKTNPNLAPSTRGLLSQKEISQGPFESWWVNSLKTGKIHGSGFDDWPSKMRIDELYKAFCVQMNEERYRGYLPSRIVCGRILKRIAPSVKNKVVSVYGSHYRQYSFPLLEILQLEWEQYIGAKYDWTFEE